MAKQPAKTLAKPADPHSYKDGAGLAAQHPSGATIEVSTAYEGPLPSPLLMRQYAEIDPELPSKIIQHFETEQTHRRKWENDLLDLRERDTKAERSERRLGQLLAFIIALFVMTVSGAICLVGIYKDNKTGIITGGSIGGVIVVSLVTAFLAGRNVRQVMPKAPPAKSK